MDSTSAQGQSLHAAFSLSIYWDHHHTASVVFSIVCRAVKLSDATLRRSFPNLQISLPQHPSIHLFTVTVYPALRVAGGYPSYLRAKSINRTLTFKLKEILNCASMWKIWLSSGLKLGRLWMIFWLFGLRLLGVLASPIVYGFIEVI